MSALSEKALARYCEFRGAIEAVRLLRREMGLASTAKVLIALEGQHLRGEPWKHLAAPETEGERLSRRQIGQVVILYRLLRERLGQEVGLALTRKLVKSVTIEFLTHLLAPLRRGDYESMDESARQEKALDLSRRFVNAEADVSVLGLERVDFTVRKCWFFSLSERADVPELAALFCAGDEGYFESRQPEIRFQRTTTLANGGTCCDFELHWVASV